MLAYLALQYSARLMYNINVEGGTFTQFCEEGRERARVCVCVKEKSGSKSKEK